MAEEEPEKPEGSDKKKGRFKDRVNEYTKKMKKGMDLDNKANYFWNIRFEVISGVLVLLGIILAFFYRRVGGVLVGVGFGICFFEELLNYFTSLRDFYSEKGLFKTLILIGVVVYFLIVLPSFIIAAAIGFAAMYLLRIVFKQS
ncbi:MAG: hypothetical protein WAM28_06160 [Chlamydiales bacterium]